jgi:hypothetical protein
MGGQCPEDTAKKKSASMLLSGKTNSSTLANLASTKAAAEVTADGTIPNSPMPELPLASHHRK